MEEEKEAAEPLATRWHLLPKERRLDDGFGAAAADARVEDEEEALSVGCARAATPRVEERSLEAGGGPSTTDR